jgi:hypothetical protein
MEEKIMRHIYSILFILALSLGLYSCSNDNDNLSNIGYLQLSLDDFIITDSNTKTAPSDDYDPKKLEIVVKDASGKKVIDKAYAEWPTKGEEMEEGKYTITASSIGFDGETPGFDIPYYVGTTNVEIKGKTQTTAYITCSLANVKVSVEYDESVKGKFESMNVQVYTNDAKVDPLDFSETENRSAYFPAGKLNWKLVVITKNGSRHERNAVLAADAKAKEHYKIKVKLEDQGSSNITIEILQNGNSYTAPIYVPLTNDAVLFDELSVNPWAKLAILSGKAENNGVEGYNDLYVKFKYRVKGATEWTKVATTKDGELYTAQATGLQPNTQYEYRMIYEANDVDIEANSKYFTTDVATALPNGNMDDWYLSSKTWYAVSESDYSAGNLFWDSSNTGTSTGLGAIGGAVNPTTGVDSPIHTAGGKAAQIKSTAKAGVFAAASLYAGSFGGLNGLSGATINFGRPFTARPTQLKGWFQYNSGVIDKVGDNQPSNTVSTGDQDMWSAYVVLSTGTYSLDNTDMAGTAKDFPALLQDDNDNFVVAYGALPDDFCQKTVTDWTEFTVDLTYKNLTAIPTHIIIVFSASKYGDYFTGSTSSVLYLDDLELVYGDSPKVK